ncbi:MAG: AMP-binding protein [Opitutae bacterium]|nr:AMP-binding protein [Opitutae bacterium]
MARKGHALSFVPTESRFFRRALAEEDCGVVETSETIVTFLRVTEERAKEVFCYFWQSGAVQVIRRGALRQEAEKYARFFRAQGVQPGEVVLIILRHSPDLLHAFLGAMLAGAIPSFMPFPTSKQEPALYWRSHRQLFARIGTGALLTYESNIAAVREHAPDQPLHLLTVEQALVSQCAFVVDADPSAEAVAFLQHSSGTTGLKKGVALTHAAVLRQVRSYATKLQITQEDCIVSWLPLYHDMGLIACFLLPLLTGVPVVMLDPFEWVARPGMLFEAIRQYRGTLCWLPNFAFHHLCRTVRSTPQLDLRSMRAWIDCSEPCRAETFRIFAHTFARAGVCAEQLQVCYAMAETVFAVTQTDLGVMPRTMTVDAAALRTQGAVCSVTTGETVSILSTGRPISGLDIAIVDNTGQRLPEGRVGEIAISGDCLFAGYYKLEEETRRKLRHGWYYTGDLGFLHAGELFVTGRKHDLIIVHGRNYYAHELEYLVNQVPGVHPGRNVAVGWFRPEAGSEEVVIIAESGDQLEDATLASRIKQTVLDQTGLLVFDVHVAPPGWLVKTTSGKISRSENLRKYQCLADLARS